MKQEINKFGSSNVFSIEDLKEPRYFTCTACMSIWADALSWCNANPNLVSKSAENATNIIVLSCQVTDLAILNDLRTLESLHAKYPNKSFFVSGCLSKRFDIELPDWCSRLELPKTDHQIYDRTLVDFSKPFWVENFKDGDNEYKNGHLFRNMYPLRIGSGCKFACKYCTIRITRGQFVERSPQLDEFIRNDDILLIADSPNADQIKYWCAAALRNKKQISIRNIESHVVIQ